MAGVSLRDYTALYKIKEYMKDTIAPKYFNLDEIETMFSGSLDKENKNNNNKQKSNNKNEEILNNTYELIIECIDEIDMQEKFKILQKNNIECRVSTI